MKKQIFDPQKSGSYMTIVCFISGSGTNYREIVTRNPNQHYLVFTNRPNCKGVSLAKTNKHEVIELNHIPFLKEARKQYGAGNIPRNTPERLAFEQKAVQLIEGKLGGKPDLICLAGYDQWNTDWFVDRYYPHILNVHPGDTTKGYAGLHWIPAARALLAGENSLRSTLFFVNKSQDEGPVLTQSLPLEIIPTLEVLETRGAPGLTEKLHNIVTFATQNQIASFEDFQKSAGKDLLNQIETVSSYLQDAIKVAGDWKIYPFAVHDLISRGRVAVDDKTVYVDGTIMPVYGYRPDEHRC